MSLSIPYPTLSDPPVKKEIEDNFAALVQKTGSFDTSDLSATAGIVSSQLAEPYQDAFFTLRVRAESLAGGWPGASTVVDAVVVPGINDGATTDPAWDLVQISWACNDVGAGSGVFQVQWGHYDTGAFTSVTSFGSYTIVATGGANAAWAASNRNSSYGSGTLAFSTTPRCLALVGITADATCLSAAGSFFECAIGLRRSLRST
jgi:hypothetical protein